MLNAVEASNAFASSFLTDGADDATDRAIVVVKPLVPRRSGQFVRKVPPTFQLLRFASMPIACPYRAEYEHFISYGFLGTNDCTLGVRMRKVRAKSAQGFGIAAVSSVLTVGQASSRSQTPCRIGIAPPAGLIPTIMISKVTDVGDTVSDSAIISADCMHRPWKEWLRNKMSRTQMLGKMNTKNALNIFEVNLQSKSMPLLL